MKLAEELQDHHASGKAGFLAEGHDEAAADALALEALGQPEVVAASAAETLQAHCWMAFHPYLFTLVFSLCALAFNVALIAGVVLMADHSSESRSDHWFDRLAVETLVGALNWLTLLAGGWFLFWISRRSPTGWKTLVSTSVGLALAVSMIGVWYIPHFAPGYGPSDHHITITLTDSPVASLILWFAGKPGEFRSSLGDYSTPRSILFLSRLLLPAAAALGLRSLSVARLEGLRSGAAPGAAS